MLKARTPLQVGYAVAGTLRGSVRRASGFRPP